jgi:hypothetical protein
VLNHFLTIFEKTTVGRCNGVGVDVDIDEVGYVTCILGIFSYLEVKISCIVVIFILSVDF